MGVNLQDDELLSHWWYPTEVPMTSSVYLALLFGSYVLVVSVSMIWNRRRFVNMMKDFIENSPLVFLTGVLVLMGGVSVICFHNIWTPDWRGALTFIGWVAAIEGALMILVPEPLSRFAKTILSKPSILFVLGITYLAIGVFFIFSAVIQLGSAVT